MTGRILGGRYEIIEGINTGGMAYVYKAYCRKSNSTVAVKILKEKFSDNPDYVKRFKKEAQAAFALEHENIVRVSDIGCEDGVYYMVMEYIPGSTLKAVIERDGLIAERDAILYAVQICSALSIAHKRGIIHRDIKPQNILLDKHKTAKVTDFGIAKSLSANDEGEEKEVIGSVYYVSPEQARGETVDARTDIYSLGIMLYEMLTGELPYKGDQTVSVALKHINEKITAPKAVNPAISQSVNNIVLKATSKNKKDRYRTMDAFKEDLVRALVDTSGDFVELPDAQQAPETPDMKKHKLWKSIVLVATMALVGGIAVLIVSLINGSSAKMVSLPDLSGKSVSDASRTLTGLGLNVQLEFEQSLTVKEGIVIFQAPGAGSAVALGGTVTLTVANGPAGLLMPDVTGLTLNDARALVESMGLTIENVTYDYSGDLPAGTVISQSPEADSEVDGNNPLSLIVSTDAQSTMVSMPLLNGLRVDQAVASLRDDGFANCFVYEGDSELAEGTVYDQQPVEGIPVLVSDEIYIWISRYRHKDYHASFSASVEVPDKESKIEIALQTAINGVTINFIVGIEQPPNSGRIPLSYDIGCMDGGVKKVIVYVNDAQAYSQELEFVKSE